MKIKSDQYAAALLESIKSENDLKKIAQNFWYFLQKNGQYRDLDKILVALEAEYTRRNNIVIASVTTAQPLSVAENRAISEKLEKRFNKKVIIKENIKNEMIAGMVVRVGDIEIDSSIFGRTNNLKKILNKSC